MSEEETDPLQSNTLLILLMVIIFFGGVYLVSHTTYIREARYHTSFVLPHFSE